VLVQRSAAAAAESVGDRRLVVDPDGRHVVTLSPTGSVVWDAIDGRRDTAALARHLLGRTTGGTVEQAERDVAAFVDELLAAGLVQRVDAPG
jgi:hypothetical protein